MTSKLMQFLGLAMRAGKIISGEEVVVSAVRQGKVKLVLLANDASQNTAKKVRDKTRYYHVPLMNPFSRSELGHAIGKEERVVVGVTDAGFADKMMKLQESE